MGILGVHNRTRVRKLNLRDFWLAGGDKITVTVYNKTRKTQKEATFLHAFEDIFDEDSA